ncbi:MAG: hypothetical protein OEY49_16540, partial [Candidatus Heimdallarchaeota archaeon]|nr:hypothetical protein [Candidatus Heimdallarchaeota archaeon]
TLLILHYMCGSLATAGRVWAERVYVYTKKIIINKKYYFKSSNQIKKLNQIPKIRIQSSTTFINNNL